MFNRFRPMSATAMAAILGCSMMAMAAPAQAAAAGRLPLRSQTMGRMTMGVMEDKVETMPTFPVFSAAISSTMPRPVPRKAEVTISPKSWRVMLRS